MLVKALLRRIEGSRGKLPGERELALALGASRPSLREALGVLEALRLIERRPQLGRCSVILRFIGNRVAFSPPMIITEGEIDELFDRFTAALDSTAAMLKAA